MDAVTYAITHEIARLEKRREKITSILEANHEERLFEVRKIVVEILQGNNTGTEDALKKIESLADEEEKLYKQIKFKCRNAKRYFSELEKINGKLYELQTSSTHVRRQLLSAAR